MIFRDVEGPASLASRACVGVPRACTRMNPAILGLLMPAMIIMSQDTDKAKRGWYRQTLSIPREARLVGVTQYPDIADELCLTAICDS